MKKSFTILAAVLMTLCIAPAALAETPAPTSDNGAKVAAPIAPQLYSEEPRVPYFTYISEEVVVDEGDEAVLLMEFSAYPVPTVFVRHNGRLINLMETLDDKSPKYIVTSTSCSYALRIRKCVPSDSGNYSFRVENHVGVAEAVAPVVVMKKLL